MHPGTKKRIVDNDSLLRHRPSVTTLRCLCAFTGRAPWPPLVRRHQSPASVTSRETFLAGASTTATHHLNLEISSSTVAKERQSLAFSFVAVTKYDHRRTHKIPVPQISSAHISQRGWSAEKAKCQIPPASLIMQCPPPLIFRRCLGRSRDKRDTDTIRKRRAATGQGLMSTHTQYRLD